MRNTGEGETHLQQKTHVWRGQHCEMTTKTAVTVKLSHPESRRPGVCTAEGRVSVLTQSLWKSTEDLEWILILECWNSLINQDVRDPRVIGYLPRRATNVQWNQHWKKKCAALNKGEQDLDLEIYLSWK